MKNAASATAWSNGKIKTIRIAALINHVQRH